MEDRYEIKGKIGHGGLGTIYRAYDTRMNREVAIKRIRTHSSDGDLSSESTNQLVKEAGALASLQHPNIVTIYDVGTDSEGPFVVMELLTGESLEEIITRGSFTWEDFSQIALQTMEALIAAHELNLVHCDIKPSNIMLTWLPSGKLQIKIVDFGLAKFASATEIDVDAHSDADNVFGSIHFMAPEQFERAPLDHKIDLYAVGCVFYYALTGAYPFDGETATEVMTSHLHHNVTHLKDLREGLPIWACDWIMWHINRNAADRPDSPRDSLKVFLENDKQTVRNFSKGQNKNPNQKTRVLITQHRANSQEISSTKSTQKIQSVTEPLALSPPPGSKPSVHTTDQSLLSKNTTSVPKNEINHPLKVSQKLDASKTLHSADILKNTRTAKKISDPVKIMITAVTCVIIIFMVIILLKKKAAIEENNIYNSIVQLAAKKETKEISIDRKKLNLLLNAISHTGANYERNAIFRALYLAEATDGTDIDQSILDFVINRIGLDDVRFSLIKDTLGARANPNIATALQKFIMETKETNLKHASLIALKNISDESHLEFYVKLMNTSPDDKLLKEAENNIVHIIGKQADIKSTISTISDNYNLAEESKLKLTYLRILGHTQDGNVLAILKENLNGDDINLKIASITALGNFKDKLAFDCLIEFLNTAPPMDIRTRAYDSALIILSHSNNKDPNLWENLYKETKTKNENLKFIRQLANLNPEEWIFNMLNRIISNNKDKNVVDLAERAVTRLTDVRNTQK